MKDEKRENGYEYAGAGNGKTDFQKFTEDDGKALYEIYSDIEVNRFLPRFPLTPMEETKVFFRRTVSKKMRSLAAIDMRSA